MFCEFCAVKPEKCIKLTKSFTLEDGKKMAPNKYLQIFRRDLVVFAARDSDCIVCESCLLQLRQCFEFVQQMDKAQELLKLLRQKQQGEQKVPCTILPKPVANECGSQPTLTKNPPNTNSCATSTTSNAIKKRTYKCPECPDTVFSSHRQLRAHENSMHISNSNNNNNNSNCSICTFCCSLFANAETLEKHQNEQHADGRFLCAPCAKHYKSKGHLLQHVSAVHAASNSGASLLFYCTLCPTITTPTASTGRSDCNIVEFVSRAALQQHFEAVHLLMPSTREDDDDDVEIEMNEEFLDEFLLAANTNDNSFQFSDCWDALDLHLTDILHESEAITNSAAASNETTTSMAAFKCPKCSEDCADQKSLFQHLSQTHALNLIICNKCECSFHDAAQLAKHKATSSDCAPSKNSAKKCEICAKTFKSNASFIYHKNCHTRRRQYETPPMHTCPFCAKDFPAVVNLKQHLRIVHSQLKRHTCLLCDKQFATLDHLKKHVLAQHQNERRHICQVCAKSFTQLSHLKQHLAIHTTGKTQKCDECEAIFWRKIDLKRHVSLKHA